MARPESATWHIFEKKSDWETQQLLELLMDQACANCGFRYGEPGLEIPRGGLRFEFE